MRAARAGGDQVDIAFAHGLAVFGEGHTPRGAFPLGKVVVATVGKTLTLEQRNHRLAMERLLQVVAQAALVLPGLHFGRLARLLVDQRDLHARHQHRLAAQQVGQFAQRQSAGLKIFGVGPHAHRGALLALTGLQGAGDKGLDHVAAREHQARHLALAVAAGFQPRGQGIGHAHAHAVQATREAVGAALALVELAARMQAGEDQLDHRGFFFRVHAKRYTAPVVFDGHRAVGVQCDLDFFAKTRQRLVGSVVEHFLNDMQRVVGAGVHARALLDRLQPLEHTDRPLGIFAGGHGRRFGRHGADCSAAAPCKLDEYPAVRASAAEHHARARQTWARLDTFLACLRILPSCPCSRCWRAVQPS